jgi:hypothetical protein
VIFNLHTTPTFIYFNPQKGILINSTQQSVNLKNGKYNKKSQPH